MYFELTFVSLVTVLSFCCHLITAVTRSEEPQWLQASRADGKQGLVPANYLEMLP